MKKHKICFADGCCPMKGVKMKIKNYKNLIGKYIIESREDEEYFYFITKDNYKIAIEKFVAYCGCNVGEYIDEITIDGNIRFCR